MAPAEHPHQAPDSPPAAPWPVDETLKSDAAQSVLRLFDAPAPSDQWPRLMLRYVVGRPGGLAKAVDVLLRRVRSEEDPRRAIALCDDAIGKIKQIAHQAIDTYSEAEGIDLNQFGNAIGEFESAKRWMTYEAGSSSEKTDT